MLLKTLFKRQYFWYHKLDIFESSTDRRSPRETLRKKNSKYTYVVHRIIKSVIACYFYFSNRIVAQAAHAPQGTDVKQDLLIKDTDVQVFCTLIMRVVDK